MYPLLFQLVRSERSYARVVCAYCFKELVKKTQKKFCSSSCATSANNRRPDIKRRQLEGACFTCGTIISATRKYCKDCRPVALGGSKKQTRNRRNYICTQARRIYFAERPKSCVICGYDKHVDVCHIVDVGSYPEGTSYLIINHPANLIGLCPNHHWEFDHDSL